MQLEPIIHLPNMITGMWRRLGVHAFEGTLTLDDMARIEAAGELWHRKNPGKVVEMVVIFPSEARLSGEERARMARIIKRWESVRTASATVVLASGLLGSRSDLRLSRTRRKSYRGTHPNSERARALS